MVSLAPLVHVLCATDSRPLWDSVSAILRPAVSRPYLVGTGAEPTPEFRGRLGGGYKLDWAAHGEEPVWLVHSARSTSQPVAVVVLDSSFRGSGGVEQSLRALWNADPHVEVVLYAEDDAHVPHGMVRDADEGGQLVVVRRSAPPEDLVLAVGSAAGRWSLRQQLTEAGRGSSAVQAALQMFRPRAEDIRAASGLADLDITLDGPTERILDGVHLMRDALESYEELVDCYRKLVADSCQDRADLRAQARQAEAVADLPWLRQSSDSFVESMADAVDYVRTAGRALRHLATHPEARAARFDVNASISAAIQDLRESDAGMVDIVARLQDVPAVHCPVEDLQELLREVIGRAAHGVARRGGRRLVVTTRRGADNVVVELEPDLPEQRASGRSEAHRRFRIRLPVEPAPFSSTPPR
ncbi:MAG: hypothetical protein H6746_16350 [Deltaproteobacteria bacterium]|nr:hypothetical protein [Deltaproteobacteria bacterium]